MNDTLFILNAENLIVNNLCQLHDNPILFMRVTDWPEWWTDGQKKGIRKHFSAKLEIAQK